MKILNKIWPWSVIDRLETALDKSEELGISWMEKAKAAESKLGNADRRLQLLEGHNAQLSRQVGEYRQEAAKDVRSGYIMADKQQATDIKFRSVKVDLQVMKKICKQASGAIRYAAQQVKDNKVQGDLRRIAELIHPDAFNTMGIENMRSADMVETTGSMRELVGLSNGRIED